ncbi:hypothetical protein CFP56_020995 [Quercus suber]|uniref:Uncharacterized protein n=1 Tax=Quercus suber TaxID=58331 RepID=A0AAW0LZR9_QUESU
MDVVVQEQNAKNTLKSTQYVIGAAVIVAGFYAVLWAQSKEEEKVVLEDVKTGQQAIVLGRII